MDNYDADIGLIIKNAIDAGATVRRVDSKKKSGIYINGKKLTDDKLYECLFNPFLTNGDWVRSMDDDELAEFLSSIQYEHKSYWLKWLQEEIN